MTKTRIQRPIDWRHASLNLVVLIMVCALGYYFDKSNGILLATALFLITAFSLRSWLGYHHRKGVYHCRQGDWNAAIAEFSQSLMFFEKNRWLDRFRGLTMLSSGHSYIEMALISLGYCHIQLDCPEKAFQYYQNCLQKFPDSQMARNGLLHLDKAHNSSNRQESQG